MIRSNDTISGAIGKGVRAQSDLDSALRDLSGVHERLFDLVNSIEERLGLLMVPTQDSNEAKKGPSEPRPPSAPVVHTLWEATYFVRSAAERLQTILDRLAV